MTYLKNLPYLLYYATLALLSLAGCKSLPLDQIPMKAEWNTPKDIFFTIKPNDNGKEPLNFTASEVDSIIRGQWSTKSISALRSSRLPERTKYTLLFILATREIVEKNNSCENLELVSVDMFDGVKAIDRQVHDSTSTLTAEIWNVDACGAKQTHHIGADGSIKMVEDVTLRLQ